MGLPAPWKTRGRLVRKLSNESKRKRPFTAGSDSWLSCMRSTSTPNFKLWIPRVRKTSSPPLKEFQARDFSERRTPPFVGAPEKLVKPGTERTSPAKPPGTNPNEGSSMFEFKILVKPPGMPTPRVKPKRAPFRKVALKAC